MDGYRQYLIEGQILVQSCHTKESPVRRALEGCWSRGQFPGLYPRAERRLTESDDRFVTEPPHLIVVVCSVFEVRPSLEPPRNRPRPYGPAAFPCAKEQEMHSKMANPILLLRAVLASVVALVV